MSHVTVSAIEPWIKVLWDRGGTDLLLTAGAPPLVRIDGALHPVPGEEDLTPEALDGLVHEVLPPDLAKDFDSKHEVDFSFEWQDVTRFRGNAFMARGNAAIALRAIPYYIPTFEQLGLPPVLEWFCGQSQGLVLFTGPTGSGKSTTQASMVDFINARRPLHILTLEDPIEYVHRRKSAVVNQREIGVDTATFASGLRSALREDPDVLLVGEMRDPESIQTTLTIAETGHLVFATLHTNDTATAIDRIVDVFPSERQGQIRTQLAASLRGVVAQRLVPRTVGGMAAAFEVLVATSAVRSLIREGKSHQIRNFVSQGAVDGMQTLEASLSVLVERGVISYDDAVTHAVNPREVRRPPAVPGAAPMAAASPGAYRPG